MKTLTLTLPKPHAAQLRVIRESRRFNVLMCGRRWGKTVLGEDRLIAPALAGFPVGWFSPTYRMLTEVWREVRAILRPITTQASIQERWIRLITGGVVDMWSLEEPEKARGRKYKRVVIDEAAVVRALREAWQFVIRPTLTDYQGDAWFLSTPKGRENYFAELYRRGQSDEYAEWQSWRMPTSENPFIAPSEISAARLELPAHVYDQEYDAALVDAPGGRVYDTWQDSDVDGGNVTTEADYITGGGSILWAADQGYAGELDIKTGMYTATSHPRVFLLCQLRANGVLCVFAEDYAVKTLPEKQIKDVLALGYPMPDYAAVDRSAAELKGRLHEAGIYTRNGASNVEESIMHLRGRLAPDENGVRLVLVHPRCRHLRAEMARYTYNESTNPKTPIKAFDHGPDALRYLAWTLRHG